MCCNNIGNIYDSISKLNNLKILIAEGNPIEEIPEILNHLTIHY